MECNLGRVLDISAGGMRVLSSRPLKGRQVVELSTTSRRLKVFGDVIWCKKVGFRKHEAGLEYVDRSPELARALGAFATA